MATSIANGLWSAGSTWDTGAEPAVSESVSVRHDVTMDKSSNLLLGITHSTGILDVAGYTLSGRAYTASSAAAKTITGAGTLLLTGASGNATLTITSASNLAWDFTGDLQFTYAGASDRSFNFGTSRTIPNNITWAAGGAGIASILCTTAVTFTGLVTVGNAKFLKWTSGATYNFAQKPVLVGASGAVISMVVTTPGTPATLNYSGAGKIQTNYLDVTDTNVTPADTWYAADSTINSGTGWVAGVIPAGNLGAFEQGAFAVGAYETGAWR